MALNGFTHSAMWFVSVGTIVETTVRRKMKNLLEVMANFLFLHVKSAEALNAWCVNDVASISVHFLHFGKGRGMLTRLIGIADFTGTKVEIRKKSVDKG